MKNLTKNKRVTDVDVCKSGNGLHLEWRIDGKQFSADGEFWIDKDNILHHSTPDPEDWENDEKCIEILVQL